MRAGRDEAPYECVAENGVGDAVSAEATLSVYEGMYEIGPRTWASFRVLDFISMDLDGMCAAHVHGIQLNLREIL